MEENEVLQLPEQRFPAACVEDHDDAICLPTDRVD